MPTPLTSFSALPFILAVTHSPGPAHHRRRWSVRESSTHLLPRDPASSAAPPSGLLERVARKLLTGDARGEYRSSQVSLCGVLGARTVRTWFSCLFLPQVKPVGAEDSSGVKVPEGWYRTHAHHLQGIQALPGWDQGGTCLPLPRVCAASASGRWGVGTDMVQPGETRQGGVTLQLWKQGRTGQDGNSPFPGLDILLIPRRVLSEACLVVHPTWRSKLWKTVPPSKRNPQIFVGILKAGCRVRGLLACHS